MREAVGIAEDVGQEFPKLPQLTLAALSSQGERKAWVEIQRSPCFLAPCDDNMLYTAFLKEED